MSARRAAGLLLLIAGLVVAGCAHREAWTQAVLVAPLDSVDCYQTGDVYAQESSPCDGFFYSEYGNFSRPGPERPSVVLSGDRRHQTRVVITRTDHFGAPINGNDSTASGWSSFADPSSAASAPRMAPVTVVPPTNHPTVSRSN